MHYLIDGHNLIAKMPDIALDDPNDEALLVLRLRSWVAGSRKRRVTVIFDGGLPGGRSRFLSSDQLKVIFASTGKTADALLIGRINKAKNPAEFRLVSSDLQIINAARARRMKAISAEDFANLLSESAQTRQSPADRRSPDATEEPAVSQEEVVEWLELFEAAPKVQRDKPEPKPRPEPDEQSSGARQAKKKPSPPDVVDPALLKRGDGKLSGDEVDEWLKLFGQGE